LQAWRAPEAIVLHLNYNWMGLQSHPCRFRVLLDQGCILAARMGQPVSGIWVSRLFKV
jgi:hypothetical protein